MKKFYLFFISIIFCFLMISCSNLYQDFSTTTVEFTKESIASIKSRASGDDENYVIFATITCGKKTQTKTVDIAGVPEANGVTLQFDKLPVGKTGTLYVSVGSKKAESDLETYYSENIADLDAETQFTVQPNGNTKIKVSLKENEENFFAQFLTFPYNDNSYVGYTFEFDFTEYSTITAPLPVGTTRWSISTEDYPGQLIGSFGEKIDVKNELMKYREKFFETSGEEYNENVIQVCFEATGNPMNQIKTPIVYSSFDSTSGLNDPCLYNFANSLNEVGENPKLLFNSSELTDYCFDNAGNLYFIMDECAYKLAYDFDTNSYESAIIDGEFCYPFYSDISAQSIAYDKAQNALYLLGEKTGVTAGGECVLVKFSNPAGKIYKKDEYHEELGPFSLQTESAETDSQSWTAHNGKIYVASVHHIEDDNSNSYNLVLQEYEYDNNSGEWTSGEDEISINVNNTNLNFTTDIMFQDGSLYVIFRCYNTYWNNSNNYSTGGILKYDISSQTFDGDFKGFSDVNFKTISSPLKPSISFYAPTNETESTSFYGPTKFVAIMPKKLVFLDQGASIDDYAYKLNNNKIPTKTRIVEYDLKSNSFSSKEITSSDLEIMLNISL